MNLIRYFWDKENMSLQRRIYSFLCLMGIFNCIIGDISNIVIKAPLFTFITTIALGILFILLLLLNKYYRPLIWVGLASILLTLNISWFNNAGYLGSTTLIFIVSFCYFEMLVNKNERWAVLLIFMVNMIALAFVQSFRPGLIIPYNSAQDGLIDTISNFFPLVFLLFFVINIVMNSYGLALEKISEKSAELEIANLKLKELDRVKTDFFSNVSHEFRTPLTMLQSPLEAVIQGDYGKYIYFRNNIFSGMLSNCRRLLKLVNNLLDFAKIEAGRMELHKTWSDVSGLVGFYVSSVKSAAESRKLTIVFNDRTDGVFAMIDSSLFEKAVFNLLSNALKFTPPGGSIIVELNLFSGESFFSINIKDTGIGIPEDKQKLVFDRFTILGSSVRKKDQGTGIGLALAKEIIELHNGSISLKSREGKGSDFAVKIPIGNVNHDSKESPETGSEFPAGETTPSSLILPDIAPVPAGSPYPALKDCGRKSILIIEDTRDLREMLKDYLDKTYNVITACDGNEGLEFATLRKPDIIISDIMMPELDGIEMTNRIRSVEELRNTPVIFLTAKAEMESRIAGFETGAVDYITKPFNLRELSVRIKTQLDMKTLRDEALLREAALSDSIKQRKAAEKKYYESEKRFIEMADLLPLAVINIDIDGKVMYVNNPGMELLGIGGGRDVAELDISAFIDSSDEILFKNEMNEAKSGKKSGLIGLKIQNNNVQRSNTLMKISVIKEEEKVTGFSLMIIEIDSFLEKAAVPGEDFTKSYGLSRRETEIIKKLFLGFPNKRICRELFISESTVKTHLKAIYRKLGVANREELFSLVKSGLLKHCSPNSLIISVLNSIINCEN